MDGMWWLCVGAGLGAAGAAWFLVAPMLRRSRSAPRARRRDDGGDRPSTAPGTAFGRISTIR